MAERRINPETGVREEKGWLGWSPTENERRDLRSSPGKTRSLQHEENPSPDDADEECDDDTEFNDESAISDHYRENRTTSSVGGVPQRTESPDADTSRRLAVLTALSEENQLDYIANHDNWPVVRQAAVSRMTEERIRISSRQAKPGKGEFRVSG